MGNQPGYYKVTKPDGTEADYPRVTSILSRIVRKPELERWNYWRTIDSISGLASSGGGRSLDDVSFREILEDSLTIDEWLRLNRMRPDDYAGEASGRGETAHNALAQLAAQQEAGEDVDRSLAMTIYQDAGGYEKGVADWWLQKRPEVAASEQLLVSHKQEYAGTCDLIILRSPPTRVSGGPGWFKIVDLKTRNPSKKTGELEVYKTDLLQVTMYAAAWMEGGHFKPETSVLLVGPDSQYREVEFEANVRVVPAMIELDKELRREVWEEPDDRGLPAFDGPR